MNARESCLQALKKIYRKQAYSQLVMKDILTQTKPVDRGLVSGIVYGTLQNHRYVRYLWQQYAPKPVRKEEIRILLDMSVYQLVFLDKVPTYAVVHEAVSMATRIDKLLGGFVNQILRKVADGTKEVLIENAQERLAVETSHPTWLIGMWQKQYGMEACLAFAQSSLHAPLPCARVNTLKATREDILAEFGGSAGTHSPDAVYFSGGNLASLPCYEDGRIAVQDEGSQMVSVIAGVQPHWRVLDVCAAPGSKTLHMAASMRNQGQIIAQELHSHRAALIEEACNRMGADIVEVKVMDSLQCAAQYETASFDLVLVDAPCSGFGVMRRKPDIKLRASQDELDGVIALQASLLEEVHTLCKIEGHLVYSTCTLNKKENETQVTNFLKKHPAFILEQQITLDPSTYEGDGFFVAKLKRTV